MMGLAAQGRHIQRRRGLAGLLRTDLAAHRAVGAADDASPGAMCLLAQSLGYRGDALRSDELSTFSVSRRPGRADTGMRKPTMPMQVITVTIAALAVAVPYA